jgi:hypothetical protein
LALVDVSFSDSVDMLIVPRAKAPVTSRTIMPAAVRVVTAVRNLPVAGRVSQLTVDSDQSSSIT